MEVKLRKRLKKNLLKVLKKKNNPVPIKNHPVKKKLRSMKKLLKRKKMEK